VRRVAGDQLPVITGSWLAECKQLIEECGGSINKFLGDGFFAYWYDRERTGVSVGRALEGLKRMQDHAQPPFRVVVHYGRVFAGGAGSMGEESLQGTEVNFAFRMEKLAASIGEIRMLSEPAWGRLVGCLPATTPIGEHSVPGFEEKFPFHSF
jgi:class 3 adenylate cyclase